ncbi:MAG: LAGLIDADG family homing endonuclease [Trichodesmium sp. MO_231.B1]|nr:LAGLIDADG family homing endonuclease [Trichodesmium sp. MO_231.B1]
MVRELEKVDQREFPETAPTANPVFYRTYSRKTETGRETWVEVCDRTINGLRKLGQLTPEETDLLYRMQSQLKALSSGRWLWVGGTEWITQQQNFSGAYNCSSTNIVDWRSFGLLMDLAMMGCGTGAVLEPHNINQLPPIRNHLNIVLRGEIGSTLPELRRELTEVKFDGDQAEIFVGDSRQGWVGSYQALLELSTDERFSGKVNVIIDLSDVRPAGEPLKGFGGVANPVKLPELYQRCGNILNQAVGRQLNSVECCLLIDEAAVTIVAGNIRRSAGMRQGNSSDRLFAVAKDNLWRQDENGNWGIDPKRDALRMANHTHVFHHKPTLEECVEAVRKQFYSGEGAIQWGGEAVARANRDLLSTPEIKSDFLKAYGEDNAKKWFQEHYPNISNDELEHRLARLGLNPCVTADTWIHTEFGARQVKELIGVQHGTFVNGELFSTTPDGFFETGTKPILKLETKEGFSIRLTENHLVLKIISQTQKKQYTEWVSAISLKPGDRVCLHNHREIQKWDGEGTFEEGWLLGSMVGDGSIAKTKSGNDIGILRYWGKSQNEMLEYAIATLNNSALGHPNIKGCHHNLHNMSQVTSSKLAVLGDKFGINRKHKVITSEIERGSYNFYCGFLRGIFDADGSVQGDQNKGVSIRLAQSNLNSLLIVQRMLARIGIISTVYQNRRSENVRKLPDSNRDLAFYHCKANHELVVSKDNLLIFQELVGFKDPVKSEKLTLVLEGYKRTLNRDRFTATVKSITPDGTETVYDCTVPGPSRFDANGFVVHNCGEIIGSNFHCVSEDTLLITRDSIHKIKDIVGQKVEVWNGKSWSQVIPFKTGKDRKLYRVKFGDGSYLDVTEYHRFFVKDRFGKNYQEVQTKDLLNHSKYVLHTEPFVIDYQDGDSINLSYAYTLGVAVGDGTLDKNGNAKIRLYSHKAELIVAGNKSVERQYNYLPTFVDVTDLGFSGELLHRLQTEPDALNIIASWNKPAILAFIAGLADTDGSNTNSNGIRIYLSDYERAKRLQLLLTKCGIRASVNLMANRGSTTNLGTRNKDIYYLQITDCSEIPCQRLDTSKGCEPKFKGKNQIIQSVEELPGLHDTYCFEEPEFHKGVFGNTLTGNCNLSEIHLNQIDPNNHKEQEEAFTAGALSVATLLNHKFVEARYSYSRELDPIVGVSFTGLFDFFVKAFGIEWLRWWQAGRPETIQGLDFKQQEAEYLIRWREIVHRVVWDYCDRHNLKRPNRCTTIQPSGTKSLLTNAAPGWHPPFGLRWVRRITFAKNDPVALACLDYGYSVIPGQSSKDENGNLLNDPFDERAQEWLVEIPVQVSWIDLPGVEEIAIEKFSATSMFDFYMGVQKHWTTHNSSSTILLTEAEIEPLGTRIYEAIRDDEGYISSALLARFDAPFPRLPFERISQEEYEKMQGDVLQRRKSDNFSELMNGYVLASELPEMGPQDPACSGMVCELKGSEPQVN